MPVHDTLESQAEADIRVARELRELMTMHGVTHILDLPRDIMRGEVVRLAHEAPTVYHRILLERPS